MGQFFNRANILFLLNISYFKTIYLIFQLSNGDLKRVEELTTEDFVQSAKFSLEVGIDQVS
jgi:hypothetical protein